MDIIIYSDKRSWVHQLDPRARILAAALSSVAISLCHDPLALGFALASGVVAVSVTRVPVAAVLQRLVPLNGLLLLLSLSLLFFTPGETIFTVGVLNATAEGFRQAMITGLKANAIVLLLAALLGSIELVDLGHAMSRLKVPPVLTHIFLFTIRYMGLMLAEFERLSRAAQLRGFRPGANRHTLRTTGFMVGMLLVRSYARGERILNAMRLRGYNGALAFDGDLAYARRDGLFAVLTLAVLGALLGLELK
jgi:cobalt/nickel transport system permease protein